MATGQKKGDEGISGGGGGGLKEVTLQDDMG